MQFRRVLAVSAAVFVGVMGAYGCSSNNPIGKDGGDAGNKPDTGKADVSQQDGGGCPSGLACEQCDVSTYQPGTMSKPVATPGACSGTQITAWITACDSSTSTNATCSAWMAAQPDAGTGSGCVACLGGGPDSAATWGAIHCVDSTHCFYNFPGCADLVANAVSQEKQAGGTGSCGDAIYAWEGCDDFACGTCPSNDGTGGGFTGSSQDTCGKSAQANECKNYITAIDSATGVCALINGDAAPAKTNNCFPQTDADLPNFFDVFCGSGP